MTATRRDSAPPMEDRVRAELQRIRASVVGVTGSLVATSDGLLVAHDVPDLEPTQIAALAATTLAVASRATLATGRGQFREAVVRGSDGYLAVYAAGESAIVAVIGSTGLNVGMLQYQARDIIERVALLSAEASAQARTAAGRTRGPAGAAAGAQPPGAQPPGAQSARAQPPGTQPPGTQPPGTQPPGTQPPGTQPPDIQPPDIQPPDIQPAGAQPTTHRGLPMRRRAT